MESITPADLARLGALLYGDEWQTPLAAALGVSLRSVQRWAAGGAAIPDGVAVALHGAAEGWRLVVESVPHEVRLGGANADAVAVLADALRRRGLKARVVA